MTLIEVVITGTAACVIRPWRYERLDSVGRWMPLEAPDPGHALLLDVLAARCASQ